LTTSTAASADRSLFEICSRDDPKPRISAYLQHGVTQERRLLRTL
jgi:hypothetical protein